MLWPKLLWQRISPLYACAERIDADWNSAVSCRRLLEVLGGIQHILSLFGSPERMCCVTMGLFLVWVIMLMTTVLALRNA